MLHKVKDWMSSPVIVIDPDSSVSYALTLMRRRNIHSLVVVMNETEQQFGMITITDIRNKIIATGRKPGEATVQEIMTFPVMPASAEWSLTECSIHMQEQGLSHLPVVDEYNNLVGIISTTDIFIAAEEIGWEESR